MMQSVATPTGRRKLTSRMLSAQAAYGGSYDPTTPGKVLSAFKRASNALGIPRRLVDLVDYLVGRTFAADWSGDAVMAWPSNATLGDVLDLGRTQIKTLIRVGQELGLFEMRDAPNGQRYGHRHAGRVTSAYGFDLTPLAVRKAEFEQIAAAHAEQRREAGRLRAEIIAVRNRVLSLAELGEESGAAGDWKAVASEAYRIAGQRSGSYDPRHLSALLSELRELHEGAIEAMTPAEPVGDVTLSADQASPDPVNTDPKGPENRPAITPTNSPYPARSHSQRRNPSAQHRKSKFGKGCACKNGQEGRKAGERPAWLRRDDRLHLENRTGFSELDDGAAAVMARPVGGELDGPIGAGNLAARLGPSVRHARPDRGRDDARRDFRASCRWRREVTGRIDAPDGRTARTRRVEA